MKKLLTISTVLLAPLVFLAPLSSQAAEVYLQGSIGHVSYGDVSMEPFTSAETGTVSGVLAYDSDMALGLEVGLADFERHNVIRLGLGWQKMDAKLNYATVNFSGGTQWPSLSGNVSGADLQDVGFNFDNDIDLYSLNLYYDIHVTDRFKPYLGLGAGLLDVEHADDREVGMVFSAGLRYAISEQINVGFKYQFTRFDGLEDEIGFGYGEMESDIFNATVDFRF